MDKQQAIELVKNTFEAPFDKGIFTLLVKNLLNEIEDAPFSYKGNYIPDAFKQYICSLERIGKYTDGKNRIDILIAHLKKDTSIERARTMQRNFIAWYLNGSRGGEMKDAALVAFVSPDTVDWRFSLVKMDYHLEQKNGKTKIKEEFTPARRWSFLVGANENSHTAQSKLVPLLGNDDHKPYLAELEEAFNIEKVTKEFFEKYRGLFIWTKDELDRSASSDPRIKNDFENRDVNTVNFAKKLLGQIIFLYYLQKKGWFGVEKNSKWGSGSKHFLRELFEKTHGDYKNFFNDILEPLFYEALRNDRSHDDHYYRLFNCKIPFLNGGLFDPMNNYDWVNTDINLSNDLFSNKVKTKEGDTGNGILDIFDRYNFTVREDEPYEKEVAIDPELLGKAYEKFNAIRPDNYGEFLKALTSGNKGDEGKFNKQYGVYYTPREIVHYICQQALINYLYNELNGITNAYSVLGDDQLDMFGNKGKTGQLDLVEEHSIGIPKADIETLIHYGETLSENEARVESEGRETKDYYYKLPESIRINAPAIDKKLTDIKVCDPAVGSGAFPVGMMSEIIRARNTLSVFVKDGDRSVYGFKRECIENALYGVDIDPGAVEIAKLRLWLSLVVDEDDIRQIKPLPNLDYKIVRGNSLIGFPDNWKSPIANEIESLKHDFFNETNPKKKNDLKNNIDKKISTRYDNSLKTFGYSVNFDFRTVFSEVFHDRAGFDVVIGNPPYVQIQNYSGQKIQKELEQQKYETYAKTGDIYCLFYEKGYMLLKPGGVLAYITSNKWMRANYGRGMRKFFLNHGGIATLIDFGDAQIFENATTYTNILIINKDRKAAITRALDLSSVYKPGMSIELMPADNGEGIPLFNEDSFVIVSGEQRLIKKRIEELGTPLKDWNISINYGIKTGLNEAFIIDGKKKDSLISEDPKSTEILKPILRGRDIKRYKADFADLWLINSHTGYTNKNKKIVNAINIERDYPAIWKHLKSVNKATDGQVEKRSDQGNHWSNLRHCAYLDELENEKILYSEIVYDSAFYYDNEFYYPEATLFVITGKNLKYLTALLNSKLLTYAFKTFYAGGDLRGDTFRYKKVFIEILPVLQILPEAQLPFEALVDSVLFAKKNDMNKEAELIESVIDGMVYDLYFEEEMKQGGCYITDAVAKVVSPFKPDDTDEFKNEYVKKLYVFFNKDKKIYHGLIHRRTIDVVKIINGACDERRKD